MATTAEAFVPVISISPYSRQQQAIADRLARIASRRLRQGKPALPPGLPTNRRRETIVALTALGHTRAEIAAVVGLTVREVSVALYEVRKFGFAQEDNSVIDHQVVPAAIEQLHQLVEAGDKDAIFAVLRGRGVFKTHAAVSASETPAAMTQLTVKFDMPPNMTEKPVLQGTVVGTARLMSGDEGRRPDASENPSER